MNSTACVFLFPGQGSQYVGMGKSFYDDRASVRRLFEEASDVTGMDLKWLCFEAPEAELVRTAHVQPAITLVNRACFEVLQEDGVTMTMAAGHSLGEYAALCAAGVFTFAETMRLVKERGRAMEEAATRTPGGMLAVFGLDVATAWEICREAAAAGSVEVANQNSLGQLALTGEKPALERAAELAKTRGAKLTVPLKVSGAWHSRFMASAQGAMQEALAGVEPRPAAVPVIANVTARPYEEQPHAVRKTLVDQIVSPVLWSQSMAACIERGHRLFVESGPGKVLSGLMKDINREAKAFNVQDADTLAKFKAARSQPLA